MRNPIFVLLVFLLFLSGCEKWFFDEDIANTPQHNFDIFWNDFNLYYPFFEMKRIDWDSVYSHYNPMVTSQTTSRELFEIMSDMIKPLHDGHVHLISNHGTAHSYPMEIFDNYHSASQINPRKYLYYFNANNSIINHWSLINHNIGYISINSFHGKGETFVYGDKDYEIIDEIIQQFKEKEGIIIDIRWNGGGLQPNFETIASRFADKRRLYVKVRSKNGPNRNDFSDWINWYIEPKGAIQYNKPVVVLTSRKTGSAAEWFTLAMQTLPNIIIVGDTTAGAFSPQLFRELPNGWSFGLSTQIVATHDFETYEGSGIPPDITAINTAEEKNIGIDLMLEKAIESIENIK